MLVLSLFILAALEPGLPETQEAAARMAAGVVAQDQSREARARASHWAPQLRAQGNVRTTDQNRAGVRYGSPLLEEDTGAAQTWSVSLAWDFSQIVFAKEETQLAVAQARLAQLRRDARVRAAELWVDRKRELLRLAAAPPGAQRASLCLSALHLTAQLDAFTGGLFREAVEREEQACATEVVKR
ncbi:MAG TPA: hypothetical protein VGH20_17360 [Myxococcales bacterium]